MQEDGSCIDINECKGKSPCQDNAFCKNTVGDFECTCLTGMVELLFESFL